MTITILTGAGILPKAGIGMFRSMDGLWAK